MQPPQSASQPTAGRFGAQKVAPVFSEGSWVDNLVYFPQCMSKKREQTNQKPPSQLLEAEPGSTNSGHSWRKRTGFHPTAVQKAQNKPWPSGDQAVLNFPFFAPYLGRMKDSDTEVQRSGKHGVCSRHPAHPWPSLQSHLSGKLPHHQSGVDLGILRTKPCLFCCFTSWLGSLGRVLFSISTSTQQINSNTQSHTHL